MLLVLPLLLLFLMLFIVLELLKLADKLGPLLGDDPSPTVEVCNAPEETASIRSLVRLWLPLLCPLSPHLGFGFDGLTLLDLLV